MVDSAVQFLERRRSSAQSIGSLQPELYRRRGSSIIQEGTSGCPSSCKIYLQLCYDFTKSDFAVTLLQVDDFVNTDDDFHFALLFDGYPNRESKKFTSPVDFQPECFKYAITYDEVLERVLDIRLIEATNNGLSQLIIGRSTINLSALDPSGDIFVWATLDACEKCESLGELLIGVQYLPSAGRLTVVAHQARNLKCASLPGHVFNVFKDGCVRVNLMENGKVQKKRKSSVRRGNDAPVWDEALSFKVTPDLMPTVTYPFKISLQITSFVFMTAPEIRLRHVLQEPADNILKAIDSQSIIILFCRNNFKLNSANTQIEKRTEIEVSVVDYDRIGNHKIIGKVLFGKKYTERMWKDLMCGENIIPRWMPLKPP